MTKEIAKQNTNETAITNWDEELAKQALASVEQESHVGIGNWIRTKRGNLTLPAGTDVPGNAMACIILDSLIEYQYYLGKYDPDNTRPPLCFAFGRDEPKLVPHDVSVQSKNNQADACKGCKHNEWGSADVGKGKACKNVRRLAVAVAGSLGDNGKAPFKPFTSKELGEGSIYLLKVPVTSVRNYAQFVRTVADSLQRPPYGVITKLYTTPDDKNQYEMSFSMLSRLEASYIPTVMEMRENAMKMLSAPHLAYEDGSGKSEKSNNRNPKNF